MKSSPRQQHGFGAIAALVVLVLLAALAAAIVSLSATQSITATQDVLAARAWQAARAGNEWGFFQARTGGNWGAGVCDTVPRTATLNLGTDFMVTVTCTPFNYSEGESTPGVPRTLRLFRIVAVACPAPAATCPNNAAVASPSYVERTRAVIVTQ